MPNAYVDDSNPQKEDVYWAENGLTITLQYFIIVTVYSEPAIGNMSILFCKKHIRYFNIISSINTHIELKC